MKANLVLASVVYPVQSSEIQAVLLAESARAFAGGLADAPLWFFVPHYGKQLSAAAQARLLALKAELIPFEVDSQMLRFPLAGDVLAAAQAEARASEPSALLAWLGTNTIILQEPKAFLLPAGKELGYRPVHHTLIGSRYAEPLDPFWALVYRTCNVPAERIFAMQTHVDGITIRPYFNAGLLVTRPQKQILRLWSETFFQAYDQFAFQQFYQQDERYAIFIHQAILSGIILSKLTRDELQELPPTYNYPLHLYEQDNTAQRPAGLEELATLRHEGFYKDPDWAKKIPAQADLGQWLASKLYGLTQ